MLQEWLDYLQEQVDNGSIYVRGAQGQTGDQITEAWIKKREYYIYSNYSRAIKLWKLRLSQGFVNLCAYDCSGLGVYYWYNKKKVISQDYTANGLMGLCEKIERSELKPGDFVGYHNGVKVTHIGYVGKDGQIVESRGRSYGVVKRALTARTWNRYGRPKWLKDEIENQEQEAEEMLTKDSNPKLIAEFQQELIDINAGGNMNAELVAAVLAGENSGSKLWGSRTDEAIRAFKVAHGLPDNAVVDEAVHLAIGKEYRAMLSAFDSAEVSRLKGIIDGIAAKAKY